MTRAAYAASERKSAMLANLHTPGEIRERDVAPGRRREAEMIRAAESACEAGRIAAEHAWVREWAANRAAVRERLERGKR